MLDATIAFARLLHFYIFLHLYVFPGSESEKNSFQLNALKKKNL